jgi:hypothetical protein
MYFKHANIFIVGQIIEWKSNKSTKIRHLIRRLNHLFQACEHILKWK